MMHSCPVIWVSRLSVSCNDKRHKSTVATFRKKIKGYSVQFHERQEEISSVSQWAWLWEGLRNGLMNINWRSLMWQDSWKQLSYSFETRIWYGCYITLYTIYGMFHNLIHWYWWKSSWAPQHVHASYIIFTMTFTWPVFILYHAFGGQSRKTWWDGGRVLQWRE